MTDKFVTVLLFNERLDAIVLVRRAKPPFADCYNGPGGEVEKGEEPRQAAYREMNEETGVLPDDLVPANRGHRLAWIGALALPRNRKYPDRIGTEDEPQASIYYYAGRLKDGAVPQTVEERNKVAVFPVQYVLGDMPARPAVAGHGNLEYFIREARLRLAEENDLTLPRV